MRQLTKRVGLLPIIKQPHKISVYMLALTLSLVGVTACSGLTMSQVVPMLPMDYYQCMEATPKDLADSYFRPIW